MRNQHKHRPAYRCDSCCDIACEPIASLDTLRLIRSSVKAQNRLCTDTDTDTDGYDDHGYLHDDAHCGKCNIPSDACLISIIYQRIIHGNLQNCRGQLCDTAGDSQRKRHFTNGWVQPRMCQTQAHISLSRKIIQQDYCCDNLWGDGRNRSSLHTPVKYKYINRVQNTV